jgi:hypothetical protein
VTGRRPVARHAVPFSNLAFGVRFELGFIHDHDPFGTGRVRCVRAPYTPPSLRFSPTADEVVDEANGLVWQRAPAAWSDPYPGARDPLRTTSEPNRRCLPEPGGDPTDETAAPPAPLLALILLLLTSVARAPSGSRRGRMQDAEPLRRQSWQSYVEVYQNARAVRGREQPRRRGGRPRLGTRLPRPGGGWAVTGRTPRGPRGT